MCAGAVPVIHSYFTNCERGKRASYLGIADYSSEPLVEDDTTRRPQHSSFTFRVQYEYCREKMSSTIHAKARCFCHPLAAVLLWFIFGDRTQWSATGFSSIYSHSLSGRRKRTLLGQTALSAERRPWNVIRFVQQSSRFVKNPFLTTTTGNRKKRTLGKDQLVWKAGNAIENEFTFAPLDDVVMGGASSSNFDQATGKWKGEVTDANNGGFIGIRSTPYVVYDMSSCKGIQLKITPNSSSKNDDSLRLKVVLRDSADFNGIGWTTSIDIAATGNSSGNYSFVKVPFDKLVPTRFAQTVSGQTYFAKDQVCGVQLVFSKFEYDGALNPKFQLGDFSVQVEEIRTY